MTTYLSNRLTAPGLPTPTPTLNGEMVAIRATVAAPSTFTTTDTAAMFYVPAGFRCLGATLKSDDLDSGTTITLNVGDAGSATRFFSGSTVGQAGTAAQATAATGIDYLFTGRTRIDIVPAAGPATTAGNIVLIMYGIFEGIAS